MDKIANKQALAIRTGDVVVVENLGPDGQDYLVMPYMSGFMGKKLTVSLVDGNFIMLAEDDHHYYWHKSWFSVVKRSKEAKKTVLGQKRRLQKILRNSAGTGVSNYGLVIRNKQEGTLSYRVNANDICHARIRAGGGEEVEALLDMIGRYDVRFPKPENKQAFRKYAEFVMKHSGSKEVFKPTRWDRYLLNGVWLDVTKTATHVMSGITFLRMGSEKKEKLPLFVKLIENGIPTGVAAVIAMCYSGVEKYSINIGDNHSAFCAYADIGQLRRWANGDTTLYKEGASYSKHSAGWQVHAVFRKRDKEVHIHDFLKRETGKHSGFRDVWGVAQPNTATFDMVLEVAKEFIKQTDKVQK